MWAAKQENFQPAEKCFFLTSPFIELTGHVESLFRHLSDYGSVNQALTCGAVKIIAALIGFCRSPVTCDSTIFREHGVRSQVLIRRRGFCLDHLFLCPHEA